jgi:hypothetical protein
VGSTVGLVFLLLLVAAVLVWLLGRPKASVRSDNIDEDDVEPEILEEAEDEVRGLDAFTSPEDADDDLPDWGPGVPKT